MVCECWLLREGDILLALRKKSGDSIQANNREQKVLGSDVCIKKNKITLNVKCEKKMIILIYKNTHIFNQKNPEANI